MIRAAWAIERLEEAQTEIARLGESMGDQADRDACQKAISLIQEVIDETRGERAEYKTRTEQEGEKEKTR